AYFARGKFYPLKQVEGDDTANFARGKFYPLKPREGDETANFAREILLIEQLKIVMTPLILPEENFIN
ncbi:MAG: hypothetical protein ACO26G_06150, partial [Rickettsiales bacterium]